MSVLLDNMSLPKDCEQCRFNSGGFDGEFYCDLLDGFIKAVKGHRHRECPLHDSIRWIPCSERLPNHSNPVLVTVLWNGPHFHGLEVTIGEYWEGTEGWGNWPEGEVVAWMPLPESYSILRKK